MKTFVFTILFALIALLMPADKKKRIIFFGDSITESGIGPGGYIKRMDSMIALQGKSDLYELMGSGISGNKVYDLSLRLEEDVLSKKPDIVVIYIGVNDVWHKRILGTGTDADKFENFYNSILRRLAVNNIKAILCTPAVIGEKTDFSNEQDGDLNKYSNIIRSIADKNNLPLVDLRRAFLDYDLKNNPSNKESGILTTDRVHLNAKGNQLVAEEMLKVILAF
jgi:lysophospholipase L1-like esterase